MLLGGEMHSRAYMLLRRDFVALQRDPIVGVTAVPQEGRGIYLWNARIAGLAGTEWDGGLLQLSLHFDEGYNTRPPQIRFITIPFHPNVDPTDGRVEVRLLRENWSEECTVGTILLALQSALSQPVMEDAYILNHEAANLLREAPHTYRQMILDCTVASLRVDAGLSPYELDDDEAPPTAEKPNEKAPSSSKPPSAQLCQKYVSYDEYLTLWKGIATSLTDYKQVNQFMVLLQKDKVLQKVHCTTVLPGTEEAIDAKLEQYTMLRYGNFKVPTVGKPKHSTILQRIEELKKMYQNATQEEEQWPQKAHQRLQEVHQRDNEISIEGPAVGANAEVDELVEWTKTLNDKDLGT